MIYLVTSVLATRSVFLTLYSSKNSYNSSDTTIGVANPDTFLGFVLSPSLRTFFFLFNKTLKDVRDLFAFFLILEFLFLILIEDLVLL